MKKHDLVKLEADLDPRALRILRDVPGVAVERRPRGTRGRGGSEGVLQFGDTARAVSVVVRSQANAATAWQLVEHARTVADGRLLLVAGATTAQARDILQRHGVGMVDGGGNAHVELAGLLLHLEGRGREGRAAAPAVPARLMGKAGVAAQALLLDRAREWHVQDLAGEAGISVGLAHRVLTRLEGEGLVAADGAGPKRVRRVIDATALLDLWAEESRDRAVSRVPAYRLARDPRELVNAVAAGLEDAGIAHAVTGAAAAVRVAPFVTAVPVADIWVSAVASSEDLVAAAGAEVVESGHNVVFVQANGDDPLAFRRDVDGVTTVNPFRLYRDLRDDPRRGAEQAETLRREVIGL